MHLVKIGLVELVFWISQSFEAMFLDFRRFGLMASTDLRPEEMFTYLEMHANGAALIMIAVALLYQ